MDLKVLESAVKEFADNVPSDTIHKAGSCLIILQSKPTTGSRTGVSVSYEIQSAQIYGSVMDRFGMIEQILKDVPTAVYPMLRELIVQCFEDRQTWELINEENGVTILEQEDADKESPIITDGDGIIQKIRNKFLGN